MSAVLDQIRDWARGLKYWEQSALDKIAARLKFTERDYQELAALWEQDAGLAAVSLPHPQRGLWSQSTATSARPRHRLRRLYELNDVNALPPSQELPFSPQLTLIFGANGAGKTGYARPLGCAAFARGDRTVLPNAELENPGAIPSASIDVLIDQADEPVKVRWHSGQHCSELAGFYVFDAESVDVHLVGQNAMSVTPSILGILTKLADETDEVRARIRSAIDQRNAPHTFSNLFQGDSKVSQFITKLDSETELSSINKMASFTDAEESELRQLETEFAQLKLQTMAQRLRTKRLELSDLEGLLLRMRDAAKATDQDSVSEAENLIQVLRMAEQDAIQFGAHHFACQPFTKIGSETWRHFAEAARQLALAEEAELGSSYPWEGAPCIFCQQSLSSKAVDLIDRLWRFLASDAQARLTAAQDACANRVQKLQMVDVTYFARESSVRRLLEEHLPASVSAIEAHAESAAERIKDLARAISGAQMELLPPLVSFDTLELAQLVEILKRDIRGLESSNEGERLTSCEKSLRELQHQRILAANLPSIIGYVQGRMWAKKAAAELGTTAHITSKYNKLFESLVTEKYKNAFQSLLDKFGRNLRVSVETKGRKGQTVRQIILSRSDFPSGLPISKVLSDGEKRAVALADFLAEATTDELCDGLILDDPVNSFDADWKKELAGVLAECARTGSQVIVFTHDLPFLYECNTNATDLGVEVATHWIQKRNDKPGYLFIDNSPACEKSYKAATYAEECWRRSRDLEPAEQQFVLAQGFGALRTSYEALVIFNLFNGVVERFQERLHLDKLEAIKFDDTIATEISMGWGKLSRHIDAHLHSDEYAAVKPTPEMLKEEIDRFNQLKKRVSELKKN